MSVQKIRFDTIEGEGEAIKEGQDKAWEVSMPIGSFKWFASVPEIKREIVRRNNDQEVKFLDEKIVKDKQCLSIQD